MHPVIRILLLMIATLFIVWGGWTEWFVAALMVATAFAFISETRFASAWQMLTKLRWLLLSILLIYLFFTPGVPLLADYEWLPSWQGVWQGGHRIAVLALLVMAVSLLLQTTSRERLTAALLWLFYPLSCLGFPHERLAVRIALTMEAVASLQKLERQSVGKPEGIMPRIRYAAAEMVDLFDYVTQHAQSQSCQSIQVPILRAPGWRQWLMLLMITGVFLAL